MNRELYTGVLANNTLANSTSALLPISDIITHFNWNNIFGNDNPVEIDLGCGDGGFLVTYAQVHPKINLFGTERLMGRLNKIIRKQAQLQINNLKVARIESSYFIKYLVSPNSLSAIHLYFPDPWPKKRHEKHRLVQAGFAHDCFNAINSTGAIYIRTDNVDYYEQMCEVFRNEKGLTEVETPEHLKTFQTDFEKQWIAQGLPTNYATYKKIN